MRAGTLMTVGTATEEGILGEKGQSSKALVVLTKSSLPPGGSLKEMAMEKS